jgi:hypothetical protein
VSTPVYKSTECKLTFYFAFVDADSMPSPSFISRHPSNRSTLPHRLQCPQPSVGFDYAHYAHPVGSSTP